MNEQYRNQQYPLPDCEKADRQDNLYPVSAALGLINYRAGAEGVMWNKGLCFISILIMCAIGIALMFVKQKPEKREAKKTQHTAPKKGW